MILSIVVILFVGLIAYIHYVQGLLSGVISAVLAVVAAMMAISYYEPLSDMMNGGKFSDQSHGICLIGIFALTYLIGRVIFDAVIPGNVRMPHIVDSVGGAVCGLVAGIFALGIVMIAFQSMPFGPSIGGYARYELREQRPVQVTPADSNRQVDRVVYDELKNDSLEKDPQGLLLPVDDIVLGLAKRLSNGGALAGERPLEAVHPDLLQELFGQRIGLEGPAKHTAFGKGGPVVSVPGATIVAPLPRAPAELSGVREAPKKGEKLTPAPGKQLVAVTVMFKADAADEDRIVRVGTGGIRIVTPTDDGGWRNNFPVGTVQPIGGVWHAWVNKPDDFLFFDTSKGDRGAHFLFELDDTTFTAAPDAKPAAAGAGAAAAGKPARAEAYQFKEGTFIEVKRLSKAALDSTKVGVGAPAVGAQYYPLRKKELLKEEPPIAGGAAPAAPTAAAPSASGAASSTPSEQNGWVSSPLTDPVLKADNKLPYPIGVGTDDANADVATLAISGHLTQRKFDALEIDLSTPQSAIAALAKEPPHVQELFVPAGKRMVQVTLKNSGPDPARWRPMIDRFHVFVGKSQTQIGVYGVYGTVKQGPLEKMFCVYKTQAALTAIPPVDGQVDAVTLVFLIPADEKADEIRFMDKAPGLALEK